MASAGENVLIYWVSDQGRQLMVFKTEPQQDVFVARSGEFVLTIVEPKLVGILTDVISKHVKDEKVLAAIRDEIEEIINGGIHFVLSVERVAYLTDILKHHVLEDHIQLTALRMQNLFANDSDVDPESVLYR